MGKKAPHVETKIGDWVLSMEFGNQELDRSTKTVFFVYVDNVDAAYKRALERGAISISQPQDKRYDERSAKVKDLLGNTWRLYTFKNRPWHTDDPA